jgi:hypothetical protein
LSQVKKGAQPTNTWEGWIELMKNASVPIQGHGARCPPKVC